MSPLAASGASPVSSGAGAAGSSAARVRVSVVLPSWKTAPSARSRGAEVAFTTIANTVSLTASTYKIVSGHFVMLSGAVSTAQPGVKVTVLAQRFGDNALASVTFSGRIGDILISGNPILANLTDSYQMLNMVVQVGRDHEFIRQEHRSIVQAIEQGKPDEAERAARTHVAGARAAIQKLIAEGKFEPRWVLE